MNPYREGEHKAVQVEEMFDSIAPAYDFMNTAMSFGLHRHWRNKALSAASAVMARLQDRDRGYGAGLSILDIATGTGDVAFELHRRFPYARILGVDLSAGMLKIAGEKLEKAGCHVIYGLTGLKTHCKICLVVRREEDGIRRYVHLGTGNYNDSTARIYTDLGMFTCRESYGSDASSLFNVITGYSLPPTYHKFAVAPLGLRTFFSRMIEREIENAQKGLPCGITAKINSLVDPEIIGLLYKASSAGVPIFLIVRGICCLTPGIEGVSDNITVISIVGQLLEHSRIFLFENGGNRRVYLGSADWMQRNLDRRIELVFPVEDEDLKARVLEILETMKNDTVNARMQLPDTSYVHIDRRGRGAVNCHRLFADRARQESEDRKSVKEDKPFQPIRSNDLKEENP